jgi:hypothetical protein
MSQGSEQIAATGKREQKPSCFCAIAFEQWAEKILFFYLIARRATE